MIALHSDCLYFKLPNGERVPMRPEMITLQPAGEAGGLIDPDMVKESVAAVFHYFIHELGRHTICVEEFTAALEKVFRGFGLRRLQAETPASRPAVSEADLRQLAQESGTSAELVFFPRLRAELRKQLHQPAAVVRFRGLRGCVKQLAGAQRWSPRCQTLRDQIVAYLRDCASSDTAGKDCTLIVE